MLPLSNLFTHGFQRPTFLANPFPNRLNLALTNTIKALAVTVFALFAIALCAQPIMTFLAVPILFPGVPLAVLVIYLLSRQRWNWSDDSDDMIGYDAPIPLAYAYQTAPVMAPTSPTVTVINTYTDTSPRNRSYTDSRVPLGTGQRTPAVFHESKRSGGAVGYRSQETKGESPFDFGGFRGGVGSFGGAAAQLNTHASHNGFGRVGIGTGARTLPAPISSGRVPVGGGIRTQFLAD